MKRIATLRVYFRYYWIPFFLCILHTQSVVAEKLRSWLGPNTLGLGAFPSPRVLFGFATAGDKQYIFGGLGTSGLSNDLYQFERSTFQWTVLDSTVVQGNPPQPRNAPGFTSVDGKLYMFGGWGGLSLGGLGDFQQFDPSTMSWTELDVSGEAPSRRGALGLAAARSNLFAFGGTNPGGLLNDMYKFDLSTGKWTNITATMQGAVPSPRSYFVFVSFGDHIFLFGGADHNGLTPGGLPSVHAGYNDLYKFDTLTLEWKALSGLPGPIPVKNAGPSFAVSDDALYIFGGLGLPPPGVPIPGLLLNTLEIFNFTSLVWEPVKVAAGPTVPPASGFGCLTSASGKLLLFGGLTPSSMLNMLFEYDPRLNSWSQLQSTVHGTSISARASLGLTAANGKLFVFGGSGYSALYDSQQDASNVFVSALMNDLHQFDPWTLEWKNLSDTNLVSGKPPVARSGHGMATIDDKIFVFGGSSQQTAGDGTDWVYLNDLHQFDVSTLSWRHFTPDVLNGTPPCSRSSFGFSAASGKLYVFGGSTQHFLFSSTPDASEAAFLNDLHMFDPAMLRWTTIDHVYGVQPSPRAGVGFASAGNDLYLFGGIDSTLDILNDLYRFDIVLGTWISLQPEGSATPSPRSNAGFTSSGGKLFLFGGKGTEVLNDLYMFDPIAFEWRALSPDFVQTTSFPTPRVEHGLASINNRLYVFAGADSDGMVRFNDLWALDAPYEVLWSDATSSAFVDVYDWDTIVLDPSSSNLLENHLELCTGLMPCSLSLSGSGGGSIQKVRDGSIACHIVAGCIRIALKSVDILCTNELAVYPTLEVDGSRLEVVNSSFLMCSSQQDGGTIKSYGGGAQVIVQDSMFIGSKSSGFGGAISAVGISLDVSATLFVRCTSALGGGAISVDAFQCYGSDQTAPTLAVINSCTFDSCRSDGSGGAVRLSSEFVLSDVTGSIFTNCSSKSSGGALSATGSTVSVVSCDLENNTAGGLGGGAFHSQSAFLSLQDLSCLGNRALSGGGGVLFWESSLQPDLVPWCGEGSWRADTSSCVPSDCTPQCSLCSSGKYQTGRGFQNESGCRSCEPGTYSSAPGATACSSCPAGTYSAAWKSVAPSTCVPCSPGTYSTDGSSSCIQCNPGLFSTIAAANSSGSCVACQAGMFSGSGATKCTTCQPGTASSDAAAESCVSCNAGVYNSNSGASVCIACSAGTYASGIGLTACSFCASGSSSEVGSITCSPCELGELCKPVLYISDQLNARIRKIKSILNTDRVVSTLAGNGFAGLQDGVARMAQFSHPAGCCMSADGTTIFAADLFNQCIRMVDAESGAVTTLAGSGYIGYQDGLAAAAMFTYPTAVAISPDGSYILVAEIGLRIRSVFIANTSVSTLAGSGQQGTSDGAGNVAQFGGPTSIIFSPNGSYVFVADFYSHNIRQIRSDTGYVTTIAGSQSGNSGWRDGAAKNALFLYPISITATRNGSKIYVAEYGGQRIRVLEMSSGIVSTLAGNGKVGYQDGYGSMAMFSNPLGLGITRDGKMLFLSDESNQGIRMIETLTGLVRSMAGMNGIGYQDGFADAAMFAYPWGVAVDCEWVSCSNRTESSPIRANLDVHLLRSRSKAKKSMQQNLQVQPVILTGREGLQRSKSGGSDGLKHSLRYFSPYQDEVPPSMHLESESLMARTRSMSTVDLSTRRMCGPGNAAAYGNCFASSFARLDVQGLPTPDSPSYPGLPFTLSVIKTDAYNQKITTDAASLLQAESVSNASLSENHANTLVGASAAGLKTGMASFSLTLQPDFASVIPSQGIAELQSKPFIYFKGVDTQTETLFTMESSTMEIIMSKGNSVCPIGYVLVFSQSQSEQGSGHGTCSACGAGTYSVSPLAGITSGQPSCLNCPPAGLCKGGDEVVFSSGVWVISGGIYKLVGCPRGHQLVNSINGIFSHDIQQCTACSANQYIMDSNNSKYSCQNCPVGAYCDGNSLSGRIAGSVWEADTSTGTYHLVSCPAGYNLEAETLDGQQCVLCPAQYYCTGGATPSAACPSGTYSTPGANTSASCIAAVFVEITVVLAISQSDFTSEMQTSFQAALAASAGVKPEEVVLHSIAESGRRNVGLSQACLPSEEDSSHICFLLYSFKKDVSRKQTVKNDFENFEIVATWRSAQAPSHRSGRAGAAGVQVVSDVAVSSQSEASAVAQKVDANSLNTQLAARGLPPGQLESVTITTESPPANGISTSLIIGVSIGAFVFLLLSGLGGFVLLRKLRLQGAQRAFLIAFRTAKTGDKASQEHLPSKLRAQGFTPEEVIGKGAYGCVIRAKTKQGNYYVAIKVIVPEKGTFQDRETRQLLREGSVLELFSAQKSEHAVHLAGVNAIHVTPDICWFIMEFLRGDNLEMVVRDPTRGPLSDLECIKAARNILAALKIMHAEGLVHRDIKPANVIQCVDEKAADTKGGERSYTYKLIDFGTALGVDETVAREALMTIVSNRALGAGTPPYMSPEMFKEPQRASYPTDLWSLGVTMFEIVTGTLPFEAESDLLWSVAVASDMTTPAPSVLDKLAEDQRSRFDHNVAKVIGKALEKHVAERYQSADEMHEAVYGCLIERGEAFYSVFISYRVASDAPLAHLLFDELNHTVTPGGHRVTVYWDAHRLVKGEDWEQGFTAGLANSLCIFPLLSYGSTAPLAPLPDDTAAELVAQGWEERPAGRARLQGVEEDAEDNVLKEFMIAAALLERRVALERAQAERPEGEAGMLQCVYPLLIGRQHPLGHPDYPRMGELFPVLAGAGRFLPRPSPPTSRAVARFLRERAGLPAAAVEAVEGRSVAGTMQALMALQGCQMWQHPADLPPLPLTRAQRVLIGKGCAGPLVALEPSTPCADDETQQGEPAAGDAGDGGTWAARSLMRRGSSGRLTAEQRARMVGGLDEAQLQMLKAQIRHRIPDFHHIIDRAAHGDTRRRASMRQRSSVASEAAAAATAAAAAAAAVAAAAVAAAHNGEKLARGRPVEISCDIAMMSSNV